MKCRAVLFDLDGVLIDSTACIVRHWKEWALKHGLDYQQILRAAHGVRTIETMRLVAPHLNCEEEAALFCENEIRDTEGILTIPGASELLEILPPGSWTLVTSCSLGLAKSRLVWAGLPIPPVMVTADDVKRGKPAPEPYLKGAQCLGVEPEDCLVVEDAPAGVEAGKSAGMRVVGVASTHAPEALRASHADLVMPSLRELCARVRVVPAGIEIVEA